MKDFDVGDMPRWAYWSLYAFVWCVDPITIRSEEALEAARWYQKLWWGFCLITGAWLAIPFVLWVLMRQRSTSTGPRPRSGFFREP